MSPLHRGLRFIRSGVAGAARGGGSSSCRHVRHVWFMWRLAQHGHLAPHLTHITAQEPEEPGTPCAHVWTLPRSDIFRLFRRIFKYMIITPRVPLESCRVMDGLWPVAHDFREDNNGRRNAMFVFNFWKWVQRDLVNAGRRVWCTIGDDSFMVIHVWNGSRLLVSTERMECSFEMSVNYRLTE